MKEVVCIVSDKDFRTISGNVTQRPKKDHVYKVCREIILFGNRVFYFLVGFPDDHVFDSTGFVDVTGLQDEINDALKAPEPMRIAMDPFYI